MPPNKNTKCPCGSGRKYKQCCAKRRRGKRDRELLFTSTDKERAEDRLLDWLAENDDEEENERAWHMFLPEADVELDDDAHALIDKLFDAWFALDRAWKGGATPVERLLSEESMPPGERAYLQQARDARFSLWEALSGGGQTLKLRSLFTGEEVVIRHLSIARSARRGDLVASRVLARGSHGEPELQGEVFALSARARRVAEAAFGRLWRGFAEEGAQEELDALARHMPKLFLEFYFRSTAAHRPELRTAEGDSVSLTEQRFSVREPDAVRRRLDAHPELDPSHEDDFVGWSWLEPDPDDPDRGRLLGNLHMDAGELVLSTMSRERGERGRNLIEEAAGELVEHLRTEHQSTEQAMELAMDAMASPAAPGGGEVPLEVAAPILQKHFDKHYRQWLDDAIPALEGVTPRRAVRIPSLRPRVVELLRQFEASSSYAQERGEFAYDFGWMWCELGLERERG
jgi:hypothetical protein